MTTMEKLDATKHLLIKVEPIIKPSVSTGNGFSFIDKPKKFNLPNVVVPVINDAADPDDKIVERNADDSGGDSNGNNSDSDDDSDGSGSDDNNDESGSDEPQRIVQLPQIALNNRDDGSDESDKSDPVAQPIRRVAPVVEQANGFTDEQFWDCIRTLNWCNMSDGEIVTADILKIINKWPAQRRVKFIETYDTMFTAGKLQMTDDIKALGIEDDSVVDSIVSHVIGLGVEWFDNCCKGSGLLDFIVHGEHQNLHEVINEVR